MIYRLYRSKFGPFGKPILKALCLCSNCSSLIWGEVAGTILAFGRQMSGGCNTVLFLKIIHHAFRQLRGRLWDIPKNSGMSAFFGWLCQCESVDSWCKGVFHETRLPSSTYHLVWQRGPFSHLLSSQGWQFFRNTEVRLLWRLAEGIHGDSEVWWSKVGHGSRWSIDKVSCKRHILLFV